MKRDDFNRQQSAESMRNVELNKDDQLKIVSIGKFTYTDTNGEPLHYLEFSKDGQPIRMPMSDASKHKNLVEHDSEDTVSFPEAVTITEVEERKGPKGDVRYPFNAYKLDSETSEEIRARLDEGTLDFTDWYNNPDRIKAAADSGAKPIKNYTFKTIDA
jgi:hypothetical protein